MDFEVIIPTYKREEDLKKCLDSIYTQELLPKRIILVDDDRLPEDFVDKEKKRFLERDVDILYYIKNHEIEARGSNESRNKGIELAKEEVVFILDDDLILEKDFFSKIIKVWKDDNDENLVGVAGVIKNNRVKGSLEKIYNRIFGLTSKYKWDMNDVGFQVWDDGVKEKQKGHYFHGGASSYKRELVKKLDGFMVLKGGREGGEDPDFCMRAKNNGYFIMIEPNAKVFHKQSETAREKLFTIGYKDTCTRKFIFKENCNKSIKNYIWFYWACFGWILRQFLVGNFRKGFGMIKGLFSKIDK